MEYLVIAFVGFVIGWFLAFRDTHQRKKALREETKSSQDEINRQKSLLDSQARDLAKQQEDIEIYHEAQQQEFIRLTDEFRALKTEFESGFLKGRSWLANAYSEFIATKDAEVQCSLVIKPNPAWKAAETVSELSAKRREMVKELKQLQYQIASYEEYFPELIEYRDAILDEVVDMRKGDIADIEKVDPALGFGYLNKDEYDNLSTTEKFQKALDRYWSKNKSNVEIGRLYERYAGHLYEKDGWKVCYQGILKGFEDFGRDLICTKGDLTHIVQCKCWSKNKVIREKHIMQLYGTSILYRLTEKCSHVIPIFMTTTALSGEAKMVAEELDVTVRTELLERYPMIKCNVNPSTKERIYHLPFDQQYDRVIIGDQEDEFYAETVKEAEKAGFRRAYRWQGEHEASA